MQDSRSLGERRSSVLRAIVSHYVSTGEPVASKTIVERYKLPVSSATVRNDMAALEDEGYIFQPHTSAGRIPTDAGYRYFVDSSTQHTKLAPRDARTVERFFGEPRFELEEALRDTASLLSAVTDHAALVFAPLLQRSVIRHIELVPLPVGRAMVVIVTNTGRVENHIVAAEVDEVQLERSAEMLNKIAGSQPVDGAGRVVRDNIDRFPLELRDLVTSVATVIENEVSEADERGVFLEGTSNIVDEAKFADLETVRQVISALEHRRLVLEVLADAIGGHGVSVRIGSEIPVEEMRACSVVTAPYGTGDQQLGTLGVVGPTRMDYRKTIAAVHEVASHLGRLLTELSI